MVLSNEKNKVLELFTPKTDVVCKNISEFNDKTVDDCSEDTTNENYFCNNKDDSLENIIVKTSVGLLQTIKNEIDDVGKPKKEEEVEEYFIDI